MKFAILLTLAFLLPLSGRSQIRTWTFAEDGRMVTDSGDTWSFKKKGRIDAAFVRLSGTNAVLLTPDAKYRTVPLHSLSVADRSYLQRGVSDPTAARKAQAASAESAAAKRVIEATKLKHEAAARRRLAQLSLEAAERLENEASNLGESASELTGDANGHDATADTLETSKASSPKTNEVPVTAKGDAGIKEPDSGSLTPDSVRLRNQAAEKRASAARFQKEAADLERAARLLESSPPVQAEAPVPH